jgi:hypothetical protein
MKENDTAEYGRRLMEEIIEEEAQKAGLTRSKVLVEVARGIDEEEGNVRFNYTKLSASLLGMMVDRVQHSGSVGIVPQLSDQDRADLRASIVQEMRQAIPESHENDEEE